MPAIRTRIVCSMAALLFCATAALHAPPAAAQQKKPAEAAEDEAEKAKKEEARQAFEGAVEKFDAGDYAAALPLFQRADELYPGAAPKHRIAVCLDKLGRTAEAVAAYKTFIDSDPGEKYVDRVAEAQKRIDELSAALPATVTVKVSPEGTAAQITVDGKPFSGTPAPGPGATGYELTMNAGEHTVVVSAEGYEPVTEVINVKGDEKRELAITLTPAVVAPPKPAPAPEPPPVEEGGRSNVPAYVTLGIAGAGVILGTVFGIQALSAKSDFDDDPTVDNADDAERAALIADMSFGVALTFGITGAVLLFSGGDDEPAPAAASAKPKLAPYGGPTGGGMAATWTF